MIESKRCNKCGETKPHSEFSRNAASRDGLCGPCKACQARYYVANRDKRREYQASYHRDNWASNDIRDARRRGPVVNLTPGYLDSIQTGQCACCGNRPSDFLSLHLDRIDTALPYKPGNVAYLCGTCNVRKNDLSATDLLARFERGMAAGKDMAAHDLMLHMYIRREKLKHPPAACVQHPLSR